MEQLVFHGGAAAFDGKQGSRRPLCAVTLLCLMRGHNVPNVCAHECSAPDARAKKVTISAILRHVPWL